MIWYFKENPDLHLLNRLNYLKLVQHFDGHNSNQKKKRKKRKEDIQFTTSCNTRNITNLLS